MSAIFGVFRRSEAEVDRRELERMSLASERHGPDGEGLWLGAGVALGRRLLRITPEDGLDRQPVMGAAGSLVLVFDGRLDGRDELARELAIPGRPGDLPDSELAALAYEKWGEECPARMLGDFALCAWNEREQRLFLSRSSLFGRPIFYHLSPDSLAFATLPSALFALGRIARAIDEEFLADYLAHERPRPGSSFYRGIERLLPGTSLVVTRSGTTVHRHGPAPPRRELRLRSDDEYVEAFDEVFTRAVGDRLRAAGNVGLLLSGGLDSSSVAAVAAPMLDRAGRRLFGFTEVPSRTLDRGILANRYASEQSFVEALSLRYPSLIPTFLGTEGGFLLDDLADMFEALERPHHRPTNRVWYEGAFAGARSRGVVAMLHGTQGNVTMSWNGRGLLAQQCRRGAPRAALREARRTAAVEARSTARVLAGEGLLPLLPTFLYLAVQRLRSRDAASPARPWRAYSAIRPSFARRHRVDERAQSHAPDSRMRLLPDTASQRLAIIERMADVTDGIDAGYQARFGIEARDPTADLRLVELCLSLPEEQYRRDGETRWLIRRAMRERLPREIVDNRARGLPAADWLERMAGARGRIEATLDAIDGSPLAREAIDVPRLRSLAAALPAADGRSPKTLADYRGTLEWGLVVGEFIRWFERGSSS